MKDKEYKVQFNFQGNDYEFSGTQSQIQSALKEFAGSDKQKSPVQESVLNTLSETVPGKATQMATETARGFAKGTKNVYENLATVAGALESIPGAKSIPAVQIGALGQMPSEFIKEQADILGASAEKYIPQTGLSKIEAGLGQAIGEMAPAVAEFALTRNVLSKVARMEALSKASNPLIKKNAEVLTDSVAGGVQNLINEYKNSKDYGSLIQSFAEGTSTGFLFGVAPEAIKVGLKYGKEGMRRWLIGVTGDKMATDAFMKNPFKFVLNKFKIQMSPKEIEKAGKAEILKLQRSQDLERNAQYNSHIEQSRKLEAESQNRIFSFQEESRKAKEDFAQGRTEKLSNRKDQLDSLYNSTVDSIKTNLDNRFVQSTQNMSLLRKNNGEAVETAIDNVLRKDPTASVKTTSIIAKLKAYAEKNGFDIKGRVNRTPIIKRGDGSLIPDQIVGYDNKFQGFSVTSKAGESATDQSVELFLNNTLDDIMSRSTIDGEITLGWMQAQKFGLQQISSAKSSNLDNFRMGMASVFNPVKYSDEIIGKNISNEVKNLANANAKYSDYIKKYEEALSLYTKKDANGNAVPDFSMALNAVRNNDKATLRRLASADLALKPEDRLLPSVIKAAEDTSKAEATRMANLKLTRRSLQKDSYNLNQDIIEKKIQIKKAETEKNQKLVDKLKKEKDDLLIEQEDILNAKKKNIDDEIEFLQQQEKLRSIVPPNITAKITGGGLGAVGAFNLAGNPLAATGLALAGTLTSPLVVANLAKAASSAPVRSITNLLSESLAGARSIIRGS